MATTPRAGIINLNFKDVSEMAKNIADNDPWKTGIEAAGKVLTDRERYIMYQRALADAQGKERPEEKTAGELIGSGIETAGELIGSGIDGAGSALSWLGDKAGAGIDKLRALMPSETIEKSLTEETENETPSEKGSREMIGYVPNQSPIETDKYRTNLKAPERVEVQPNDEISFGFNADIGQAEQQPSPIIPFGTGEQVPEDTEEAPDEAPVVAPEKAQESGSPFEDTEVAETKIKAPRMSEMEAWSEMNRLDPQRATFDYNRVQNQKKSDIETMKALGKDANLDDVRAMHNAYMNNLTALYNQGANDDDPRVIAAKSAIEYTSGLLAEKGLLPKSKSNELTPEEIEQKNKIGAAAILKGREAINLAIDKEGAGNMPDGIIDNELAIDRALNDLVTSGGLNKNSKEWTTLQSEWATVKSRASALHGATLQAKKNAQEDADRRRNINVEGQKAYEQNPDVIAYKTARDAMLFYDASDKGIAAKRKMVYDFIKSYNTGTVLDSELASTLNATKDNLGTILNVVKSATGLPPSITDSQAEDIYKTLANQLNVLKSNADKAHKNVSKVYGTTPQKVGDSGVANAPVRKTGESITEFRKRYTDWENQQKKQGRK